MLAHTASNGLLGVGDMSSKNIDRLTVPKGARPLAKETNSKSKEHSRLPTAGRVAIHRVPVLQEHISYDIQVLCSINITPKDPSQAIHAHGPTKQLRQDGVPETRPECLRHRAEVEVERVDSKGRPRDLDLRDVPLVRQARVQVRRLRSHANKKQPGDGVDDG